MFCARKIELHTLTHDLPTALIPKELLADYTQARQMLELAETQAQALIHQAEERCESLLQTAREEFWERANAQLHSWEAERLAMFDELEHAATCVVNTAIQSILEETIPAQRLAALLNKLLAAQLPAVEANLLCNPLDRELVEQWLSFHCAVPWTLRVENGLATQSLVLETEDGGFHINWTDAINTLVAVPPTAKIK
ncbi:type III secretion system stator protein SctL [Pseudomonas sp. ICMP 460]|uniref:type III secretion system stator protein SctL n=1 Tax=Pseudomonas sp. ICMP 460 TaxID=1718917 RepID=UPI000C079635|nr:type III secretion system stator protein SctL [Pseudomonas sp. ICMP 460]PHN31699.1 type III secretion protein [Pseudomonas sp. ICMP 460]